MTYKIALDKQIFRALSSETRINILKNSILSVGR